jgi:hypothetical protein
MKGFVLHARRQDAAGGDFPLNVQCCAIASAQRKADAEPKSADATADFGPV